MVEEVDDCDCYKKRLQIWKSAAKEWWLLESYTYGNYGYQDA